MKNEFRLSIVTVHLNQFSALTETLISVKTLKKSCTTFQIEWIVVDGVSKLLTPKDEIIFNDVKFEADKFIHESDTGIYDAMNKGLSVATGSYTIFMNAGDIFLSEKIILTVLEYIKQNESVALYYGHSIEKDIKGNTFNKKARKITSIWYGMPTHHQAMFFKTEDIKNIGYDLQYQIGADYALICHLFKSKLKFRKINQYICQFNLDGISSNNYFKGLLEQQKIRKNILKINIFKNKYKK
jgi:putative colanic acid biosynthesis glycosyltransferase